MGCSDSINVTLPNLPTQLIARLIQVSDVNHQLNVNFKYQYLCKINQSKTIGSGLKKTFAYQCLTNKQQLQAKRKQFWETRNSGLIQCWNTLRMAVACKSDDQILTLLGKMKIMHLNGSIQMCVDPKGSKYQLPVFVINDPVSYENQKIAEQNLIKTYDKSDFNVKIRSVKFPNEDLTLEGNNGNLIQQIKVMIKSMKPELENDQIRLFYGGRELLNNRTLGNYGYQANTIIQAMIKG